MSDRKKNDDSDSDFTSVSRQPSNRQKTYDKSMIKSEVKSPVVAGSSKMSIGKKNIVK